MFDLINSIYADIMFEMYKALPFIGASATGAAAGGTTDGNGTMKTIVGWVGGIGGGIVAIFLIISLIKDGIALAKGGGDASPLKIAGKVIFLIVILGLIGLAINYSQLTSVGNSLANKGLRIANKEIGSAL